MGRISRSGQILPPLPNRVEHARARVELQIPMLRVGYGPTLDLIFCRKPPWTGWIRIHSRA